MHFRDTELCKPFKFWPISSFYLYIIYMVYDIYVAFINIITYLIRKLIKYWEAVELMVVDMFCQNSNFSLEISNFIFANKYCQLFSLKWQTDFLQFQENVCQISRPEQLHFVCHSFKKKCCPVKKKQLFQVATQSQSTFFEDSHPSKHSKSAFCILPTLSHSILKRPVL